MWRKMLPVLASFLLALVILPAAAKAGDAFAGDYTGSKLSLNLVPDGNSYTGSLHLGSKIFPVKAQANAGQLAGSFSSDGHEFPFTASIAGDNLTLISGSTTYQLTRNAAAPAPNPLDNPAPVNPLNPNPDAPEHSTDAPAGYSVAVATDAGKAWVTKKPGITTVAAALAATLPDLTKFFGGKPVIKGAFEDTKDHQSGAASFTDTFASQPIVGLVTCKLGDNEAKISVTYCLATATGADWAKLNAEAKAAPPVTPSVKLTRFDFPDGTGSVGIAEGWTLKSGSVLDPLYVTGPGDQTMGSPGLFWIAVDAPDSARLRQAEEMQRRSDATWRRLGRQPPPHPPFPFIVAPFSDPETALPIVFPQWNAIRVGQRLESVTMGPITSSKTLPSQQPSWKMQLLEYGLTKTINGEPRHYKTRATWTSMPGLNPGSWSLSPLGNMTAPDATFDQDLITMEAMTKSLQINWDQYMKVDWDRFEARMKANKQQFDERMKEQRRQQVETMKGYDKHNREVAIEQNRKSRNAADWIEYAGGYRTVIDTQTGERARVDLSNVNGIVDHLNEATNDPHRFVQIPLRDERDPLIAPNR